MTALARLALLCVSVLSLIVVVAACRSFENARSAPGLAPDSSVDLPAASPGPGYERTEQRSDATPPPRPTAPIDRPLDPTGRPAGP